MNTTKLTVGVGALVALWAAGFGAFEFRAAHEARESLVTVERQRAELRASIASLEKKVLTATTRVAAVESDNALLQSAVQKAVTAVAPPVTPALVEERVKQALALAKDGDPEEALRELLWCYDVGFPKAGRAALTSMSLVVAALAKLGERLPAATAALRERLEKARRRVLGNADDLEPIREIAAISRALKEDNAVLEIYDAIPPGDPRRARIAIYAFEAFVESRRYADALAGRGFSSMSGTFESNVRDRSRSPAAVTTERVNNPLTTHAIATAAKNIEVLAGVGDLEHARNLLDRVLAVDGGAQTRALLQMHLARAGQPELMPALKN